MQRVRLTERVAAINVVAAPLVAATVVVKAGVARAVLSRAVVIMVVAVLAGCTGAAVVLQEDTQALTRQIDTSVTATREFYDRLGQLRFDYLVDFVATRPSCAIESPLLIDPLTNRCLSGAQKRRRLDCNADPLSHADCARLLEVMSVDVSLELTESRQTTLTLIRAIAGYQHALASVLSDAAIDTAGDFEELRSTLDELVNRIAALRGDGDPALLSGEESLIPDDEGFDEQIVAVSALLDIVRLAAADRADYVSLKRLVVDKGPAIDVAVSALLQTYEQVDKPYSLLAARRDIERNRSVYNRLDVAERERLTLAERKQAIRTVHEAELARLQTQAAPDALASGLRGLIRSHEMLREGFRGNLSADQKRRIAMQNTRQLKETFNAMQSIATLFL